MLNKKKLSKGAKFLLSILFLVLFWAAGFFLVQSFKKNLEYYVTPSEVLNNQTYDQAKRIRIGGLIMKSSVKKQGDLTTFVITDFTHEIVVSYKGGDLPPIFNEGVGIIASGYLLDKDHFKAEQLIGKHDENYMPKSMNNKLGQ